jgi:hypothetical protein
MPTLCRRSATVWRQDLRAGPVETTVYTRQLNLQLERACGIDVIKPPLNCLL